MAFNFLKLLILLILALYSPQSITAKVSAKEKVQIEKGLAAGKALAEVLKDGEFKESLVKLGKNLSPFLNVLGPLAGLALTFIPTGDSKEMKFMKQKFQEVNNKLDIITSEFQKVKNAIDWSTVVVSYGAYERKIRAAESNLNRIYEVQGQARQSEQRNFINQYESDFDNSLQKLYDAIMNNDHVFSKNVIEAAVKQTKNHKRKVEQFSLGLIQLLIQGIKVKVSYYGLKGWTSNHVTSDWQKKMNTLRLKLQRVSNEVKGRYHAQLKVDADDIVRHHHRLGNRDLMRKLYDFVENKYDWRYWFVAVYDDMYGFDVHTISLCGGYSLLHQHKKNIIISSQDKFYSSRFKQTGANNLLQGVQRDIDRCSMRDPGDRAKALVNNLRGKTGKGCVPYAAVMATKTGKGLWYISWGNHRAYRKIEKIIRCCWGRGRRRRCKTVHWQFNVIVFG